MTKKTETIKSDSEGETLTTAELRKLYDAMGEKAHQGFDFENWKEIYCGRYAVTELKTEILKKKYAVVLTEHTAHYEDEALTGWDQKSRKLLLFDDNDQAEEALISYFEVQDYTYKVEAQKIGYVEVGSEVEEIHEKPHEPDCECGQCTGEDRALELMEKGICAAERNYGDD